MTEEKTLEEEITEQTKVSHDHQRTKTNHRKQLIQIKYFSHQRRFYGGLQVGL